MFGLPPSRLHCTADPSSPATIRSIQQCGLAHWKSFTVPLMEVCRVWSKTANEWWADATTGEASSMAAAHPMMIRT